jgi:hypothetical protein
MKPALIFVLVALAGTVIAEAFIIRRQESRLRDVEAALARQSTPEGAAELVKKAGLDAAKVTEAVAGGGPAAAAARKAAEEAVAARTADLEARLAAAEKAALSTAVGSGDPAALDELVAKKVGEKVDEEKKKKNGGGLFGDEKKRPLTEISKELGLTELQEDQMSDAIKASQKVVFDLLATPRNDGTNVLDDFVEAMKDPEHAEEKMQKAFLQIFTAKLPGSEETYLGRVMAEKQALLGEFKNILTEDQMKRYNRLGQDPHEIQTGYDPFGEYVAERLAQPK